MIQKEIFHGGRNREESVISQHITRDGMKALVEPGGGEGKKKKESERNELYQGIPTFHNSFWEN